MRNEKVKINPYLHSALFCLKNIHVYELIIPSKNPARGAGPRGRVWEGDRTNIYSTATMCQIPRRALVGISEEKDRVQNVKEPAQLTGRVSSSNSRLSVQVSFYSIRLHYSICAPDDCVLTCPPIHDNRGSSGIGVHQSLHTLCSFLRPWPWEVQTGGL